MRLIPMSLCSAYTLERIRWPDAGPLVPEVEAIEIMDQETTSRELFLNLAQAFTSSDMIVETYMSGDAVSRTCIHRNETINNILKSHLKLAGEFNEEVFTTTTQNGLLCNSGFPNSQDRLISNSSNGTIKNPILSFLQYMDSSAKGDMSDKLTTSSYMWPDDMKDLTMDVDEDDRPDSAEEQELEPMIDKEIKRFEKTLEQRIPHNLKPKIYAALSSEIAKFYFVDSCQRDYTGPCPIDYTPLPNSQCEPPPDYRGVCGRLNMQQFQNRSDPSIQKKLDELAAKCWFEMPCTKEPEYDYSQCPLNYRAYVDSSNGTRIHYCIRKAENGICSPIIIHTNDTTSNAAWSSRCNEPYPLLKSSQVPTESLDKYLYEHTGIVARLINKSGPIRMRDGVVIGKNDLT